MNKAGEPAWTGRYRMTIPLSGVGCCRIFGTGITPTSANVYVWIEQNRADILRWFVAFMENGSPVNCAEISAEDLRITVSFEMRNPGPGESFTVCPFLHHVAKERYLSGISIP